MALEVEDGTGKTNANSYISVVDAEAIITARDPDSPWLALANNEKEAALLEGALYLSNWLIFPWRGTQKTYEQSMDWPRTGATMRYGPAIPDDSIPSDISLANALMGPVVNEINVNPPIDLSSSNIKKEKVDVIEIEYMTVEDRGGNDPSNYTTIVTEVYGLLVPYLRDSASDFAEAAPYANLPPQTKVDRALRPLFHVEMHKNKTR